MTLVIVQGKFWVIACKVSETVSQIKGRIRDKMGIDTERQILVFRGAQIQGNNKLADYFVVDGATIHLVTRPGIERTPQQTSASDDEAGAGTEEGRALVGHEEDRAGRKLKPTPTPSVGADAHAAASSAAADAGKGASAPTPGGAAVDENNECVVCMDAPRQCAFVPCGHMCVCKSCSDVIMKDTGRPECPICGRGIESVLVIYTV